MVTIENQADASELLTIVKDVGQIAERVCFHRLWLRLTHIELSDETGHVVVLEKLRKDLLGKALFVQYEETVAFLQTMNTTMAVRTAYAIPIIQFGSILLHTP